MNIFPNLFDFFFFMKALQQTPNLTAQQQSVLQQLTHQFKLMQQHQLRLQQAQLRGGGVPIRGQQPPQAQQFPQQSPTNFQQPIGNRTHSSPQSGTTAQTGFMNDGSFSPATGHSQAGMPFKSAGGFQQISSTTNNQDISKFINLQFLWPAVSLVDKLFK